MKKMDNINKTISLSKFLNLLTVKKVEQIFKFYIPAQDAKLKSLWAPYLTPYISKDKLNQFCKVYNDKTKKIYNKDFFIPVLFVLYLNRSYDVIIGTPTFFQLLQLLFNVDKIYKNNDKIIYYITYSELYKIIMVKNTSYLNYSNKRILLKNYLSVLKKFNIKLIKK